MTPPWYSTKVKQFELHALNLLNLVHLCHGSTNLLLREHSKPLFQDHKIVIVFSSITLYNKRKIIPFSA